MLAGKNKELQRITKLIDHGKFSDASEKLDEFEKKNHIPEINLRVKIIKALLLAIIGSWEQGLEIIDSVISKCETADNPLLLLDAYQVKARCFAGGEQYNEAINLIKEAEKIAEEELKQDDEDYLFRKAWFLVFKGFYYSNLGNGKQSLEMANQGIPIANSLNDSKIVINYYELFGLARFHLHEYRESIGPWQKALQLAKDSKNEYWTHMFIGRLMETYYIIGKFDLALKHIELLIEYNKKTGMDPSWNIFYSVWIYWNMGEIEKALKIL
ncbi:MAG: hypothetical protein FK732_08435, partial [Asgard group archaeon]|nr:hypothetical protein [Asgard group archaeon]